MGPRNTRAELEKTYRERALKLFPWICARCGREFSGKKLRELTVHHKDHDHNNNPPRRQQLGTVVPLLPRQ